MGDLATALRAAGGVDAPRERSARLRRLLVTALRDGAADLQQARSGYATPVPVVIAAGAAPERPGLLAVLPVAAELRADPDAITERSWLLTAATVGALVDAGASGALRAGTLQGHLVLALERDDADGIPAATPLDAELAALAFDDHASGIDRLRTAALAVPAHVLQDAEDLRPPLDGRHPLLVAREVARHDGRPADPTSVLGLEDAVLALLKGPEDAGATRPHDDPDPARRAARRILQRLAGMGKWGGYHTEFTHLPRGFAPSERALAAAVGEALIDAGLLVEKPSVGQRHVFLDPRRAADIHALTDRGDVPRGLVLPPA